MKKAISVLLVVLFVLSFAGCTGTDQTGTDQGTTAETATETTTDVGTTTGTEASTATGTVSYTNSTFDVAADIAALGLQDEPVPDHFIVGCPDIASLLVNEKMQNVMDNIKYLVEACGGELVTVPMPSTSPDDCISMVEQLISLGAQGIMFMPTTPSIMPTIATMCQEAGVYFASYHRAIEDEEILATLEANPYWVGYSRELEEECGYKLTEYLAKQGVKEIAFIGESVGDNCSDARLRGLDAACEDYGMKVVGEVRSVANAAEATKACESFIASNPDLGGIVMISTYADGVPEAIAAAIENAGKTGQIHMVTCDFYLNLDKLFDEGKCEMSAGGIHVIDEYMTMANVINSVLGTPLNENGGATYVEIGYYYPTNGDEQRDWFNYAESSGKLAYDVKEIRTMLIKWFNPEITQESFLKVARDWSLDDLKARHAEG